MSLTGEPIVIGHDPYDGRQIALTDVTLHTGRRVISLEVGQERSVELDDEARRNLAYRLLMIDADLDPIDGVARAAGVLRDEPVTATRNGGGSR